LLNINGFGISPHLRDDDDDDDDDTGNSILKHVDASG
jgi:hypothetical protein